MRFMGDSDIPTGDEVVRIDEILKTAAPGDPKGQAGYMLNEVDTAIKTLQAQNVDVEANQSDIMTAAYFLKAIAICDAMFWKAFNGCTDLMIAYMGESESNAFNKVVADLPIEFSEMGTWGHDFEDLARTLHSKGLTPNNLALLPPQIQEPVTVFMTRFHPLWTTSSVSGGQMGNPWALPVTMLVLAAGMIAAAMILGNAVSSVVGDKKGQARESVGKAQKHIQSARSLLEKLKNSASDLPPEKRAAFLAAVAEMEAELQAAQHELDKAKDLLGSSWMDYLVTGAVVLGTGGLAYVGYRIYMGFRG